MNFMNQVLRYTTYILVVVIAGYLIWQFSFLIVWMLIAAVLSFIGAPVMRFLDKLRIWKIHLPKVVSALLTLILIIGFFVGVVAIFVPLIATQAEAITKIDVAKVSQNLQGSIQWIDKELHTFGMIPDSQSFEDYIVLKVKSIVNFGSVGNVIGGFFSFAGSFFIGFFSVMFITFFFIKDENFFENSLLLFVPDKYHKATQNVISASKNMLMRYFIGLLFEILIVMSLITLGLTVFGVENALLLGFFGGLMNIIPYLGPLIGTLIGISLAITNSLSVNTYTDILPLILKVTGVFLSTHYLDSLVLQPLIYSSSVKAHPLEIFLVIVMGGSLAGILGMLLAIPVYTILRVIAREFFQKFRIVQKLTERIPGS